MFPYFCFIELNIQSIDKRLIGKTKNKRKRKSDILIVITIQKKRFLH